MDYLSIKNHPEVAFKKANKVITSCTKESHLKAARKYINLFFKTYCDNYSIKSGFRVFKPSTMVADLYDTLLHNLSSKERQFDK